MFDVVKVAPCKLWCMLCVCDVYEFINKVVKIIMEIIYSLVWIKNLG
jgi:hypothetical protein